MTKQAILPSDHPRVIACSPALSAAERRAFWPQGVAVEMVAAMEQRDGIRAAAPAAKPATKPLAEPAQALPAPTANRAPPSAVRASGGGGSVGSPVAAASRPMSLSEMMATAAARAVDVFNKEHAS